MQMRTHERGLSMLGFLFVAAVVVVCAMIGFRVLPAYIEYYSVQKALGQTSTRRRKSARPFRSTPTPGTSIPFPAATSTSPSSRTR
jgi:hypothetical protein